MVTLECWWNGVSEPPGLHRIQLCHDSTGWSIEVDFCGLHLMVPSADEHDARDQLTRMLLAAGAQLDEDGSASGDEWRRIDPETIRADRPTTKISP